jgi:hypothetical protein
MSMTKVAILQEQETGIVAYRAVAGTSQSVGRTAGEALDALTAKLPMDQSGALVIIQQFRPDRFFPEEQQQRLRHLMTRWRAARDTNTALSPSEQAELEALTEAELQAASKRTATILPESEGCL